MPIALRERSQLLQAARHGGREAVLSADVAGHDDVARWLLLVGAVRPAQLLNLWPAGCTNDALVHR